MPALYFHYLIFIAALRSRHFASFTDEETEILRSGIVFSKVCDRLVSKSPQAGTKDSRAHFLFTAKVVELMHFPLFLFMKPCLGSRVWVPSLCEVHWKLGAAEAGLGHGIQASALLARLGPGQGNDCGEKPAGGRNGLIEGGHEREGSRVLLTSDWSPRAEAELSLRLTGGRAPFKNHIERWTFLSSAQ